MSDYPVEVKLLCADTQEAKTYLNAFKFQAALCEIKDKIGYATRKGFSPTGKELNDIEIGVYHELWDYIDMVLREGGLTFDELD